MQTHQDIIYLWFGKIIEDSKKVIFWQEAIREERV
jgi:hypothetical protein